MTSELKKISCDWYAEYKGVKILDPDGWDRSDFDYSFNEELITKEEFELRLMMSNCKFDGSGDLYARLSRVRGGGVTRKGEGVL